MIWRLFFALIALTALGALLYLRQGYNETDTADRQTLPAEPGYVAIQGDLIETGEDGHPRYRLDADRIEQPSPEGMIYLTAPRLDYQISPQDHWTLTALRGQLPQQAQYADLSGAVHVEGRPNGSASVMRIDTDGVLHLDMPDEVVTTPDRVTARWAGRTLSGIGMRYQIRGNHLELQPPVEGSIGSAAGAPPVPNTGGASAEAGAGVDYKALLPSCHEAMCLRHGGPLDGTDTHLVAHDITIVYTTRQTVVKADLGEGDINSPDSKNSHWTLTDHVQIWMPQGHISANRATMSIVNDRITELTAQGSPAEFEGYGTNALASGLRPEAQALLAHAHGHAREIDFDVDRNLLELSGDAYVQSACYQYEDDSITYDIANQEVHSDPRHGERGKVGILPASSGCGQGSAKP
jgi:LPS export ABC transporter protein LptC/lipopolysaccharide transport protein LptA